MQLGKGVHISRIVEERLKETCNLNISGVRFVDSSSILLVTTLGKSLPVSVVGSRQTLSIK